MPPAHTSHAPCVHSTPFHVAGSSGTFTRNRLNATLNKQHFVLAPSTLAPEPSSSKTLFDAVPRNAHFESLRPILARLPHHLSSETSTESDDDSLNYIHKDGVMYTRSPLPSLDPASLTLWRSLHHFRPLTPDYASGYLTPPHPITSSSSPKSCPMFTSATNAALTKLELSFNWSTLPPLPLETERSWYGVLFLSVRKASSESVSFYEADRLAHEEATRSGGLIMYWYGSPDVKTGENLATCIWTSRKAALKASKLELHKKAAGFAAPSYERYDLVRYKVVKKAGEREVKIEEWTEEDNRVDVAES